MGQPLHRPSRPLERNFSTKRAKVLESDWIPCDKHAARFATFAKRHTALTIVRFGDPVCSGHKQCPRNIVPRAATFGSCKCVYAPGCHIGHRKSSASPH